MIINYDNIIYYIILCDTYLVSHNGLYLYIIIIPSILIFQQYPAVLVFKKRRNVFVT